MDKESIAVLESHLRNYHSYKTGIANLKKRMEREYSPQVTTDYRLKESSRTLAISSTTEATVLKRMDLDKKIGLYQLFVDSMDNAIEQLPPDEKQFVQLRYFERQSIPKISMELFCSPRKIHRIKRRAMDQLLISLGHLILDTAI